MVRKIIVIGPNHLSFRFDRLLEGFQSEFHFDDGANFQEILCRKKKSASAEVGDEVVSIMQVGFGFFPTRGLEEAETDDDTDWNPNFRSLVLGKSRRHDRLLGRYRF